jgi:hypothetical protein
MLTMSKEEDKPMDVCPVCKKILMKCVCGEKELEK